MWLDEFASKVPFLLSTFLGVGEVPSNELNTYDWEVTAQWQLQGQTHVFEAVSSKIVSQCGENPDGFITFPSVIHGAHRLILDGSLLMEFGDPSFKHIRSFYGAPNISCRKLAGGKRLTWLVYNYTKYFSRISHYPSIAESIPLKNVFQETLNIVAAGTLIIITLFTFVVFLGKVSHALTFSVGLSGLLISGYFFGNVPSYYGLTFSMLTLHKFADCCLWSGVLLLFNAFRIQGLVHWRLFLAYAINIIFGLVIIMAGQNGDTVQLGTSLPFVLSLVTVAAAMFRLVKDSRMTSLKRIHILQLISLGLFAVVAFNDIAVVTGLTSGVVLFSVGIVGGVLFLCLSVNESIILTYKERDYLRKNLEKEVERKTSELQHKTDELEDTLGKLKATQSDLVQSAKLASLGTLSAGIAHEINNSLNYVNGALKPLEKLVNKEDPKTNKAKIDQLLGIMKEGLELTLQIIKSLRNYTGLNQAKVKDIKVKELIDSVLVILKKRLKHNIEVENSIDSSLSIFGSVVGLNQVFMNLVTNAADAMPEGGKLQFSAEQNEDSLSITVSDTGAGISKEIQDRIFEPFFTTKDVGSGTGVGLHIVSMEVKKHNGEISIESTPGEGTSFTVRLPNDQYFEEEMAA